MRYVLEGAWASEIKIEQHDDMRTEYQSAMTRLEPF